MRASWRQSRWSYPQPAGLIESLLQRIGPLRLIDQAPRATMIGWRLVTADPRVRRAPRNPAFRVDAFEVADLHSCGSGFNLGLVMRHLIGIITPRVEPVCRAAWPLFLTNR